MRSPDTIDDPAVAPDRRNAARAGLGTILAIAGIALLWIDLTLLAGTNGLVRVVIALASLVAVHQGLKLLGRASFGAGFDIGFWLCVLWLVLLGAAAALADVLPLSEYRDTSKTITMPGNATPDLFSAHPLGTNNFALDLLARSIYGARASLLTVSFAVAVSIIVGGGIGMIAGYFRGWVDSVSSIATSTVLSIPPVVLLVALASVLGTPTTVSESAVKNGLALAVVGTPAIVRLARANSMVFSQREFVLAAQSIGASNVRVLRRELLPNVILPVVSYAFILFALLVVAEGSLAYLGLGLQQPQPTWGNMIAEADLTVLRQYPHVMLVPATFMFLTVYAFNRVGERARELWDPRASKI